MTIPNGFINQADTFYHDNQNRLVKIVDHYIDDAPSDDWPRHFDFTYHGNDSLPYLMNAPSAFSRYDEQIVCDYLLYYDNLGRIIKDSTSEGTVTAFSYPENSVIIDTHVPVIPNENEPENYFHDSLSFESGNLSGYYQSMLQPAEPAGVPFLYQTTMFTYSSYSNPLRNPGIPKGLAVFLNTFFWRSTFPGFVSRQLISTSTLVSVNPPLTYSWKTDSAGRVSGGSAEVPGYPNSAMFDYGFTYQ
jgi:hypothetical protein